jgi:hypothetical protein
MSDAARLMVGVMFVTIPTIAFGGYFLLSLLRRRAGTEGITSAQREWFRAGHAHAGVLVVLGIIGQLVLDDARLGGTATWAVRIGLVAAPLLVSGGFFGGAPRTADGPPAALARLIPVGALAVALSTLAVGVGLLIPA